jgi:hypothetical protein
VDINKAKAGALELFGKAYDAKLAGAQAVPFGTG